MLSAHVWARVNLCTLCLSLTLSLRLFSLLVTAASLCHLPHPQAHLALTTTLLLWVFACCLPPSPAPPVRFSPAAALT